MLPFSSWSATRTMGFAAYFSASLVCLLAWLGLGRRSDAARLALTMGAIEVSLCSDMVWEWRISLHTFLLHLFMKYNLYEGRRPFQALLLALLSGFLALGLGWAFRRFRSRRGAMLAVFGVCLSLTLWLIEIVSLHATDAVLYHGVRGAMVIAYLWVAVCALTIVGVGIESRS